MKGSPKNINVPSDANNRRGSSESASARTTSRNGDTTTRTRPPDALAGGNDNGHSRIKRLISNISNATNESARASGDAPVDSEKARIIKRLLIQCEAVGWPFKKKLILANLNLAFEDIPIEGICSERLGPSLNKLSLWGNCIEMLPDPLVLRLGGLRTLELGNCGLTHLPECWDLPSLKKLCLRRNKLVQFPHEEMLRGTPYLEQLDLQENCLATLTLPDDSSVLSHLQYLSLDYNYIERIPAEDLLQLQSLKTLRFVGNKIQTVPELICDMDLKVLDVSSNPLVQPPLETCARGLYAMGRYYKCLRAEENKLKPESFIKATSRKLKKFPASLCRSNVFRSISEPTHLSFSRRKGASDGKGSEIEEVTSHEPEFLVGFDQAVTKSGEVAINDSLKVIFVGNALSGKTSIIKRLTEGRDARIPNQDDRTIGVDIYTWKPGMDKCGYEDHDMDTTIQVNEDIRTRLKAPIDVKFSMWDFAGQDVYHATHELFFSSQALYVLVWDMANHIPTIMRDSLDDEDQGEYKLTFDSSDEEDGDFFFEDVERRRAIRALEKDIDDKLNFWVHTIQASAPGAAILPVASFDDYFSDHEAIFRCKFMKDRLLKKEAARVEGMKQRLAKFESTQGGDGQEAELLQRLLCPFNRPKLLFGVDADQDTMRVSCEEFTGFGRLAKGIVNVATGREQGGYLYPVFQGHIGARIPRMRLEVRDLVRRLRGSFKVVETNYFLSELEKTGVYNLENVSEALHFLTSIGECSYFGEVVKSGGEKKAQHQRSGSSSSNVMSSSSPPNNHHVSFEDDKSVSSNPQRHRSESSNESSKPSGFDEFIFVNPRWLVAAVACILRHDLTREIYEVKRMIQTTPGIDLNSLPRDEFSDVLDTADVNYPVISNRDMFLLWETKRFTKKAADRAIKYSNNTKVTPFDFLQKVMVRFSICVPIDLTIDRACLGGRQYTSYAAPHESEQEDKPPQIFFLPGLLGKEEPKDAWTFKTGDSWKTTLAHTVLFPDGAPPGLMERLIGSILNDFITIGSAASDGVTDTNLRLKETLCWRTAFFMRIAVDVVDEGVVEESLVDMFVILVDQESSYCVASDSMGVGMRRLIISARGQAGSHGSKIWKGGYMRVLWMVKRYLMSEYGGLEFDWETVCPVCLANRAISSVGVWGITTMLSLAETDSTIRCRYGHSSDIRLLTALQGPFKDIVIRENTTAPSYLQDNYESDTISLTEALKSCVLVSYWDEEVQRIVRVGSGFIVDKKRGFIITAGHTLLDGNWREPRGGKILIGIIPSDSENVCCFRYCARIVSKDPAINDEGYCTLDACVLQITTRFENDVLSSGKDIGEQPEVLLQNNPELMKMEDLPCLPITDKVELDETIRLLGFNQGGEGLIEPGSEVINRSADFARGYVVMRFVRTEMSESDKVISQKFQPRSEIVCIIPTIGGHSGGPCINQQGEVIGILSRVDPADKQRCYLVPTSEYRPLIKAARRQLKSGL